jgi:hypothetical protein
MSGSATTLRFPLYEFTCQLATLAPPRPQMSGDTLFFKLVQEEVIFT